MTTRIFERTSIAQATFSSIAADSTGGGPIDIVGTGERGAHVGILRGLSIACDSTNYSLSIRSASNAQANTIEEIYSTTGINRASIVNNLYNAWINDDATKSSTLYAVIVNSDVHDATNEIKIQLITDINRPFAKNR